MKKIACLRNFTKESCQIGANEDSRNNQTIIIILTCHTIETHPLIIVDYKTGLEVTSYERMHYTRKGLHFKNMFPLRRSSF